MSEKTCESTRECEKVLEVMCVRVCARARVTACVSERECVCT